jgi:parallel beta-helix repeat protein
MSWKSGCETRTGIDNSKGVFPMKNHMHVVFVGLMMVLLSNVAYGQILINQRRALEGGVTLDDEPGFPVIINEPGSYRLSSNLSLQDLPNTNPTAIFITTSDVTIDLNGFQLLGNKEPNGIGISAQGPNISGIVIRGGTISNFAAGIDLLSSRLSTVEHVSVHDCDGFGIGVGSAETGNATVSWNTVTNCGNGIGVGPNSTVSWNTASQNNESGIVVNEGSTVISNTASRNKIHGIRVLGNGVLISSNTAFGNQGDGISVFGKGATIISNTASENLYGIHVFDSQSGALISSNTTFGNRASGIFMSCPANAVGNMSANNLIDIEAVGMGVCSRINNNPAP